MEVKIDTVNIYVSTKGEDPVLLANMFADSVKKYQAMNLPKHDTDEASRIEKAQ